MDVQGHCMAVALLQTKSMIANLEAQVDRHLLEENLGFHFATLEGYKGAKSIYSSLPGLRHCSQGWRHRRSGADFLWMALQLTQLPSPSQQPHKFNENERWPEKESVSKKPHPTFVGTISLKSKKKITLFRLPGLADKPIKPYDPELLTR